MKIETYIKRIRINRQFSQSTIESYTRILKKFDEYIKTNTTDKRSLENTQKLQLIDIEWWISSEIEKWKSVRTCNWYLICIRNFLKYAERRYEKVINYKEIILMKECKKKVEALTESDVDKLLQYMKTDESKDRLTKTRDYIILSILIFTGLRVSELCNIKISDVKKELQVVGKNHTLRLVYLFQEHLSLIKYYLNMRELKDIDSNYLFCSHSNNTKGKQLSRNSVEKIIRDAWIKAWISEPVWPHKLRHTFATNLLRRWWNIFYIKELLGHTSILTTQNYLSATNNDLKKTQDLLKEPAQEKDYEVEELIEGNESNIFNDYNLYEKYIWNIKLKDRLPNNSLKIKS